MTVAVIVQGRRIEIDDLDRWVLMPGATMSTPPLSTLIVTRTAPFTAETDTSRNVGFRALVVLGTSLTSVSNSVVVAMASHRALWTTAITALLA